MIKHVTFIWIQFPLHLHYNVIYRLVLDAFKIAFYDFISFEFRNFFFFFFSYSKMFEKAH